MMTIAEFKKNTTFSRFDWRGRASVLANAVHKGQRYGDLPYYVHCQRVAQRMADTLNLDSMMFYSSDLAVAAAWLHDSVEDTALTVADIAEIIDRRVAALVAAVTDAPGADRVARKAATYPKIRAAGPLAVALKLADRIENVLSSSKSEAGLYRMYAKEQKAFAAALYRHADGLDAVWDELDAGLKVRA